MLGSVVSDIVSAPFCYVRAVLANLHTTQDLVATHASVIADVTLTQSHYNFNKREAVHRSQYVTPFMCNYSRRRYASAIAVLDMFAA